MQQDPALTVTAEVDVLLLPPAAPAASLPTLLRYDSRDPYAVTIAFLVGDRPAVQWVLARELLAEGLRHRAGAGDVMIHPVVGSSPSAVGLTLTSAGGRAELEVPADALDRFLRDTYRVVPPGAEGPHLDVDAAIAQLLAI